MTLAPDMTALRDEALAATTCRRWAEQQGWRLRRSGAEFIGPCPVCGGTDRFSINDRLNIWNCRNCGVGGDVILLVQHSEGLRFAEACERIAGRSAAARPDPERAARLRCDQEALERQRQQEADQHRQRARANARAVWVAARRLEASIEASPVARYLQLRGLAGGTIDFADPAWPAGMPIRIASARGYWHGGKLQHTGPAMIAAIQAADGRFAGIHQTWLDLSKPKGKLELQMEGEQLPSKKVLGIKKGGAIRLVTPPAAFRLVIGEGIETTLTAYAHAWQEGTAYWAGVDLGNLSGKAARSVSGGQMHDQPDMEDRECFLPPDWAEELVFLCDGDDPQKHTVEKVTRGLRRALRIREERRRLDPTLPKLSILMVPPGEAGTDLNSLAMASAIDGAEGSAA